MRELLNLIDGWLQILWNQIKQATYIPEKSSSIYRILFGLFLLLLGTPRFSWIEKVPQALFDPPVLSLAAFFNQFPEAPFFFISEILLLILAVCISLGVKARWSALAYVFIALICFSFKYSFGKIDHLILLYLGLFCFSFTNWGCYNAIWPDKRGKYHSSGPAFLAIFLSFGMFTAGLPKLIAWVDFDLNTSGFLNWFYSGYFFFGRNDLLMPLVFQFPPILTEIMDYTAVLFELSPFIFLILGKKSWRLWLMIAGIFHLGNTLFLNINFIIHFIIYVAYFPLLRRSTLSKKEFYFLKISLIAIFAVILIKRITAYLNQSLFDNFDVFLDKFDLYIYLILWITFLIIAFRYLKLNNFREKIE